MPKPIIHGFDHGKGGADPVPGLGGIQFHEGTYGADNSGDWLQVETTDATVGAVANTAVSSYSGIGAAIVDSSTVNGGLVFGTSGGGNIYIDTDAQIALTALNGNVYIQDSLVGAGTGILYVNFGNGMNFSGGFTEFSVGGFEVDSSLGIYLSDISAPGAGAVTITSDNGYVSAQAGASHGHAVVAGDVMLSADARINLYDHGGGINIESLGGAGMLLNASSSTGAAYPGGGNRPIVINSTGSGGGTTFGPTVLIGIADGDIFEIFRNDTFTSLMGVSTSGVSMNTLGTTNPGGSGLLWNNGGVVHIT